ncbi:putative phospholipid ABC transporter permease protein MlaE [Pontiella desulfatans]|uniref:Putative phospholipid ABC transporter permease protein MlaE n=1 Tax=Pontiella desulfatans TaxID=2750659 RepID=A0A6C2U1A6_PONDE|nr:MlaE family lipid ABC transporter permease subunit [Pontiella desulfatans]VGO13760.1 putative phospholipid ABC transporter permease protein MlaE [Pontiella desulfatans]
MKNHASSGNATCSGGLTGRQLQLSVSGRLDAAAASSLWPRLHRQLRQKGIESIILEGSGIEYCDGAGSALLVYVRQAARRLNAQLEFQGLQPGIAGMLELYPIHEWAEPDVPSPASGRGLVEEIGKTFWTTLMGLRDHIAFLGELSLGLAKAIVRPAGVRAKDFLIVVEESGPKALPIISMLGFLVGLIMAFQGAVLMKQFGAEIYIADFVGISVARELGPLITAIIVAGRTGSAFAAELGTMKVNEEIDALTTMGLDPVRFLVIPRVLAATLMTPLLAVMTNLAGFMGGAVVMKGLQFPLVTYVNRLLGAVTAADYLGGLAKALVFGFLIAAAGCNCGLRTGEGASAVGNSATRAVVSSITMIVIADGIFAVLFYYLGI